jgi:hypothetical protein
MASTARLSISRLFRSLAGKVCAREGPATSKTVTTAKAVFTTNSFLQNGLMYEDRPCRSSTRRMMWLTLTCSVKIAAVRNLMDRRLFGVVVIRAHAECFAGIRTMFPVSVSPEGRLTSLPDCNMAHP